MLKRICPTICLLLRVLVFAALALAFFFPFSFVSPYLLAPTRTAAVCWGTFVFMYYMMTRVYGGYDIGKKKSRPIIFSLSLCSLISDLTAHFFLCIMNYTVVNEGRFVYESPWLLCFVVVFQVAISVLAAYGGNDLYFSINDPQKCLIISQFGNDGKPLAYEIQKFAKQYQICEMTSVRDPHILEKIEQVDAVFFYDLAETERSYMVEFCYEHRIDVYYSLEITDIVAMGGTRVLFGDKSLVYSPVKQLTFEQKVIKRLMDIAISLVALILSSPILLITAIAIKCEDHGPVFYRQKRATYGGRLFDVIKFRSMRVEDGNIHVSVKKDDDRITKVGRIIRKFRIDELPQFINVLIGDMSVVGPRPEMIENVEKYTANLPEFEYRLRVKAGITGMAQIYGKYNTDPKDKLIMDITYIETYSIWLDLKLILRTVLVLFTPDESTEAFDDKENA